MTKIAVIADTHLGVRNDHPAFLDSMKKFIRDVFLPVIDAEGIRTVAHLGDLFDRRKYVNIVTASTALSSFVEPILQRGVDLHIMVGNHDCYYRNTNRVNSIRALYQDVAAVSDRPGRGKMTLYEKPTTVDFFGLETLIVPWIPTDDVEEALAAVKKSRAKLCLGHLELEGFDMYRGSRCEHGLKQSSFDHFDTVLSGHFHTQSVKTNVRYVGAAGQYTWADYDDARGFHVMDTRDMSLVFHANPYECFSKVHYDGSDESAEKVKTAAVGGRFVKLVVSDDADPEKLSGAVDTLEAMGVHDLQVVEDHKRKDETVVSEDDDPAADTREILLKMVDDRVDWRRKEAAAALASELYAEAVAVVGDK